MSSSSSLSSRIFDNKIVQGASNILSNDYFIRIVTIILSYIFGSYYNLNIHNQVKQCLNQNRGTCSNLYTQFTNPPKPYDGPRFGLADGMWGRLERYQDDPPKPRFREYAQDLFKEGDHPYGYYNACTGKRANPGFSREGVL